MIRHGSDQSSLRDKFWLNTAGGMTHPVPMVHHTSRGIEQASNCFQLAGACHVLGGSERETLRRCMLARHAATACLPADASQCLPNAMSPSNAPFTTVCPFAKTLLLCAWEGGPEQVPPAGRAVLSDNSMTVTVCC